MGVSLEGCLQAPPSPREFKLRLYMARSTCVLLWDRLHSLRDVYSACTVTRRVGDVIARVLLKVGACLWPELKTFIIYL